MSSQGIVSGEKTRHSPGLSPIKGQKFLLGSQTEPGDELLSLSWGVAKATPSGPVLVKQPATESFLNRNQRTCNDGAIPSETYLQFPGLESNGKPPEFKGRNANDFKSTRKVFAGNVYKPHWACTRDVTLFSLHSLMIKRLISSLLQSHRPEDGVIQDTH